MCRMNRMYIWSHWQKYVNADKSNKEDNKIAHEIEISELLTSAHKKTIRETEAEVNKKNQFVGH